MALWPRNKALVALAELHSKLWIQVVVVICVELSLGDGVASLLASLADELASAVWGVGVHVVVHLSLVVLTGSELVVEADGRSHAYSTMASSVDDRLIIPYVKLVHLLPYIKVVFLFLEGT